MWVHCARQTIPSHSLFGVNAAIVGFFFCSKCLFFVYLCQFLHLIRLQILILFPSTIFFSTEHRWFQFIFCSPQMIPIEINWCNADEIRSTEKQLSNVFERINVSIAWSRSLCLFVFCSHSIGWCQYNQVRQWYAALSHCVHVCMFVSRETSLSYQFVIFRQTDRQAIKSNSHSAIHICARFNWLFFVHFLLMFILVLNIHKH